MKSLTNCKKFYEAFDPIFRVVIIFKKRQAKAKFYFFSYTSQNKNLKNTYFHMYIRYWFNLIGLQQIFIRWLNLSTLQEYEAQGAYKRLLV